MPDRINRVHSIELYNNTLARKYIFGENNIHLLLLITSLLLLYVLSYIQLLIQCTTSLKYSSYYYNMSCDLIFPIERLSPWPMSLYSKVFLIQEITWSYRCEHMPCLPEATNTFNETLKWLQRQFYNHVIQLLLRRLSFSLHICHATKSFTLLTIIYFANENLFWLGSLPVGVWLSQAIDVNTCHVCLKLQIHLMRLLNDCFQIPHLYWYYWWLWLVSYTRLCKCPQGGDHIKLWISYSKHYSSIRVSTCSVGAPWTIVTNQQEYLYWSFLIISMEYEQGILVLLSRATNVFTLIVDIKLGV